VQHGVTRLVSKRARSTETWQWAGRRPACTVRFRGIWTGRSKTSSHKIQ